MLEQAKLACEENTAICAGITCSKQDGSCTMRRGFPFFQPSPGEVRAFCGPGVSAWSSMQSIRFFSQFDGVNVGLRTLALDMDLCSTPSERWFEIVGFIFVSWRSLTRMFVASRPRYKLF